MAWVVLAFLAYVAVRYATADLEYVARRELARLTVYSLFFFLVVNNVSGQEKVTTISIILSLLAMLIAAYAVYQFATGSNYVWHFERPTGYANRGSGTYICPNHMAGFLEMVVPLALSIAILGRIGPVRRILLIYASLVCVIGIGLSLSRGAWLSAGSVLLLCGFFLLKQTSYRVVGAALLVILMVGVGGVLLKSESLQERLKASVSRSAPQSPWIRLYMAKSAFDMWLDYPVWGVGPGHFDYRFPAYRPLQVRARPGYVHNDYLNTLADLGLVGSAMVALAVFLMFASAVRVWRYLGGSGGLFGRKHSGNRSALVAGAILAWLALLIHSLFDFNMQIPANALLAVTLLAWVTSYLRFASSAYWLRLGPLHRITLTLVLRGAVGFLGFLSQRNIVEARWLGVAGGEKRNTDKRLEALQIATAIEPNNFETHQAIAESLRQNAF